MEVKIKFLPIISQASNKLQEALLHRDRSRRMHMKSVNMDKKKKNKSIRKLMFKKKSMNKSKNKKQRKEKLWCQNRGHHKCQKTVPILLRSMRLVWNQRELNNYKVSTPFETY